MRRILSGIALGLIAGMFTTSVAFAAIGLITTVTGNPASTSIYLNWSPKATGSTRTIIYYRTNTYPATVGDGTLAYNGTSYSCNVTGLISGQVYYFSVWGWNVADGYSATAYNLAMSTLPTTTTAITLPAEPSGAGMSDAPAAPVSSNFEPFTTIISYFATSGLGMPLANAWELAMIGICVGGSLLTYIKVKNFLIAYAVLIMLVGVGWGVHILQGWLLLYLILIGLGYWAVERFFQ